MSDASDMQDDADDQDASGSNKSARNMVRHVVSLSLSKSADGLVDPKLVLSWLLNALGAPAVLIGFLVPIREAGALLPQLFTSGWLETLPRRKWVWVAGSAVQGLSALAIAFAALTPDGLTGGLVILGALTVLALARSMSSVSYKDVLGRTVKKRKRGRTTGLAGSIAAITVIAFALLLSSGLVARMTLVLFGLTLAGIFWICSSLVFSRIEEEPGETEEGRSPFVEALRHLDYLRTSKQLRRFILVRGLLTATALAPPFMVSAAAESGNQSYDALGFLVLASASASLVSSFVWGWLSDRSSRKVLMLAGVSGAVALAACAGLKAAGVLGVSGVLPVILFILMVAYQGVRLGRSTHLVDMADEKTRAAFTALSNTIIGCLLLAGGAFGLLAQLAGTGWVLGVMAVMCGLAALAALSLEEVQSTPERD